MLKVGKDMSLEVSQSDYFDITFNISGLTLESGTQVYFAVKKAPSDDLPTLLRQEAAVNTETNSVRVIVESFPMSVLKAGEYVYDLTYIKGTNRRTLLFPKPFTVRGVVDNADIGQ